MNTIAEKLEEARKRIARERSERNGHAKQPAKAAEPVKEKREPAKPIPPPPWQPFPVDALPEPARAYVDAASRAIGYDASYVSLPLLPAPPSAICNSPTHRLKP